MFLCSSIVQTFLASSVDHLASLRRTVPISLRPMYSSISPASIMSRTCCPSGSTCIQNRLCLFGLFAIATTPCPATLSRWTTIGRDVRSSRPPPYWPRNFTAISRWSSPIPLSRYSPVSLFIVVTRFGSSIERRCIRSTRRGSSFGCFGSIAIVTTGSETYLMRSKGTIAPLCDTSTSVSPALARSSPSNAAIFPATMRSTTSLNAAMYIETC